MSTKLNPYLMFKGNCREAMEFYKSVLGGNLTLNTYGEANHETKDDSEKDLIMHASLENGDLSFMASDDNEMNRVTIGNNVQMSISGNDEEKLKGLFDDLSVGGKVEIPLSKQAWGDLFGMFEDKFGIHWMVNISGTGGGK